MRDRLFAAAIAALAVVGVLASPALAAGSTTVSLPNGRYQMHPGLGSMWFMTADEQAYSTLYRVNPNTMTVTETIPLGYPSGDFAIAYRSVWVTDYFGNLLHRYDASGHAQAVIPVGLQPQFVHAAFGSIWTSDHHAHSLTRVDPAANGVIATIAVGARMFRDGPQEFTWDQSYLYVSSSNLTYLQRVDPSTDGVRNLADTGILGGGDLRWAPGPLGGTLWNAPFGGHIVGYDVLGAVRVRISPVPGSRITSLTELDGRLWYLEYSRTTMTSTIIGANRVTGATETTIPLDLRDIELGSGFGYLWTVHHGLVQRIQVPTGSVSNANSN